MRNRLHDEAMAEQFLTDPAYFAALLSDVCSSEGDLAELAILERQIALALEMRKGTVRLDTEQWVSTD